MSRGQRALIRRARRNRHKPLPIVACPPTSLCLALHCRFNLLADITPSGSIAINGYGTLAPIRNRIRSTTEADVDNAVDAVVKRALELGDTCALRRAVRAHTQAEVAAIYKTSRQRIEQVETAACAVLESALASDGLDSTDFKMTPHDEDAATRRAA